MTQCDRVRCNPRLTSGFDLAMEALLESNQGSVVGLRREHRLADSRDPEI
jgi:hypothetical protein